MSTMEPSWRALALDLAEPELDAAAGERPRLAEALASCERGQVVPARRGGVAVALAVLADGRAFAVPDECPHDGGLLSDGFLDGDRLVCARHGWEFEVCSGRCPGRPGVRLPSRRVS